MLSSEIQERRRRSLQNEKLDIYGRIREIREEKKMSGAELCRRAGDLDPRTLTALEKGRIVNPSIKTLQSVSRGLGVMISDIFKQSEVEVERNFYQGSQRGAYDIDFSKWGIRAVSFTPFIKNFFCGKLILSSKKRLDEAFLKHPLPVFVSVLVGRFEVTIEGKKLSLKEGENLFFNGILKHSFSNPLERESVLLIMTSPVRF